MYTNHIPKFSDETINSIAEDCGLVLPLLNPDEIDNELDFFVKLLWSIAYNRGLLDGVRDDSNY